MSFPFWFDGLMAFMLFILLFVTTTRPKIPSTPQSLTIIVGIIAVLLLGLAPALEIVGTDRPNYAYMFASIDEYTNYDFRDVGFVYFLKLNNLITGGVTGGFIISAIIYIFSYCYFYSKSCPNHVLYILLLTFLSMGFTSHHYNVLRAGLSIAFMLLAISKNQKIIYTLLFAFIGASLHASGVLIITGYLLTYVIKNIKLLYLLWIAVFIALSLGVFDSFDEYLNTLSVIEDERVEDYLSGDDRGYKVGFRLDFITYSLLPIVAGGIYVFVNKYKDEYYLHIYRTYLLCNACWLIFNKIPHTDRIAYLSWILMPIILLYPIFNDSKAQVGHKRLLLAGYCFIVVFLNFYLRYLR